jgi:hypothetical protein
MLLVNLSATGCDIVPYDHIRVVKAAVLYQDAEQCHSNRISVASDIMPPGAKGTVEAGAVLKVTQQSLSKETLCLRIQYEGQGGFILADKATTEWVPR